MKRWTNCLCTNALLTSFSLFFKNIKCDSYAKCARKSTPVHRPRRRLYRQWQGQCLNHQSWRQQGHHRTSRQQNAALVEEMAAAASSLKSQAQELVQTVTVFDLGGTEITSSL
ncbi:MAG: hypothetical protein FP823_04570 [Rhodoferax sp.]|nr:hypothetical protein [Rhodoferax sp.]MBU4111762.1 hypothetical protein [Gammaproteobacteria bacterium]